jgi:glycosyltransferase involved in cell wall biosynthesis
MRHLPGRRLEIVGGNVAKDLERIRDLVSVEGLEDRVTLHGYVPPPRVREFLDRARVGVIPLPEKGYVEATLFTSPLKLFELWQRGVPVVATAVPSIRELAEDGRDALLVAPDDPRALATGIDRLLVDRQLAASLVASAATRVQDYSWERRAQQLLHFLSTLQDTSLGNEV